MELNTLKYPRRFIMEELKENIAALSNDQLQHFLTMTARKIQKSDTLSTATSEDQVRNLFNHHDGVEVARLTLFILASTENDVGIYLRNQIISNAQYLKEERDRGGNRDLSDAVDMLPYVALVLSFLKGDFHVEIKDGKIDFAINAQLLSIAGFLDLLKQFSPNTITKIKGSKNVMNESTIEGGRDVIFGDVTKIYQMPPDALREEE